MAVDQPTLQMDVASARLNYQLLSGGSQRFGSLTYGASSVRPPGSSAPLVETGSSPTAPQKDVHSGKSSMAVHVDAIMRELHAKSDEVASLAARFHGKDEVIQIA
ncbi:MAG: hypothetical protein ACKPKO_13850, partial [Candidatus Fonsibacter sp.]